MTLGRELSCFINDVVIINDDNWSKGRIAQASVALNQLQGTSIKLIKSKDSAIFQCIVQINWIKLFYDDK